MESIHRMVRLVAVLAAAGVGAALGGAAPVAAQYFGQNQVQYERFDFRVLATENFDILYYPEAEAAARDAGRMAERWYERLSTLLDHRFSERQPLILYANHPHFQQTRTLGGEVGEGTGGVTESAKQRIIMPFSYSYAETDHVLGHELVHAFQYDISGLGRSRGRIDAGARQLATTPLWFIEGMAEYLSVGPVAPLTAMTLRDAALTGRLPTLRQLASDPRIFPYRFGHAVWAYIGGRWGDAVIGQILKQVGDGAPYHEAMRRVLNLTLDELTEEWHTAVKRAYLIELADHAEARELARPLINRHHEGGRYNLAPSLSPDGRRMVFLSERDFIDIQLHLADAETGRVIRTLQKGSALDSHVGSLRFINSAGTWSPDGRRFAFAALQGSSDVVVVVDAQRGRRLREYRIPGVGEITNPSWSPDGRHLVLSGQHGGVTDLFLLDLDSGTARQLTDDPHADLQPAFSPDGRSIAFVTDRGPGTDFAELRYGGYRIAILELASGAIRLAETSEVAEPAGRGFAVKSINPVWTRDGRGLYFISNRTGAPEIYRLDLDSCELFRMTTLYAGVSGITDVSPALTVARDADRLLFTALEGDGYNIYALEGDALRGTPVTEPYAGAAAARSRAVLPPAPRSPEQPFNRVAAMLADDSTGLPSPEVASSWSPTRYRARLGLDYLGQPQVGVATGSRYYGGGLYGGINALFSDVLGYHTVYGAVQAQGQWDEVGFTTAYINQRNRWNFGAVVQRIPYVYGDYREGFSPAEPNVYRQQFLRVRYFDSSIMGLAQYPFSRAQRLELGAGLQRIAQDVQIVERRFSRTGTYLGEERTGIDLASYNLARGSVALVYDNTLFGTTAPLAGQRYRLEVSPVAGQLQFYTAQADYRRYFLFGPFTLAMRGLHYGRYGRDAEGVFSDLYLGYSFLLRGYDAAYDTCAGGGSCDLLGQMLGSRLGVASAELRFPLIGRLTMGTGSRFPPIDGFAFYDAGVAWNSATSPVLQRGIPSDPSQRGFLTSIGVGARMNLFGIAVIEADYVRPLELDRGWHWQISLQPGF